MAYIHRLYSCRRPAFLLAQRRIAEYYGSSLADSSLEDDTSNHFENAHPDLYEDEDERTDARITKEIKDQMARAEAIDKIKVYLVKMDKLPRGSREERIKIAEKIFETLLDCDHLLKTYPRLRTVVYNKIDELTKELDEYLDTRIQSIQKHVQSIQETLMKMQSSIPSCDKFISRLYQWMNELAKVEEVDNSTYLRSLFRQLQLRRSEYESVDLNPPTHR